MKSINKRLAAAVAAAVLTLGATAASAELVYLGPQAAGGTGLGSVNTLLTFQQAARSTTETASVGLGAGGVEVITGDALTGASQTGVLSLNEIGLTSAANLRLILNANEPAGNSLTLDSLVLNVFNVSTGSLLFTSSFAGVPVTFNDTFTGTGTSGFAFALDTADAFALQALMAQPGFGSNVFGASASASMVAGGPETLYLTAGLVSQVPEPGTYAMMLAGLGLMGMVARRRKSKEA